MMRLSRWWREPVVHFVVLGVGVFALYQSVAPSSASKRIVLSASVVDGLRRDHLRRTGAAPTEGEEQALIDQFVDNEVLYREALAMGLDRGDIIVRRRLVQKMEFLTEDADPIAEPTDAELTAYRDAHAERYTLPPRVSLTHVFVSLDRHGSAAEAVAGELRQRILAGANPADLGDPFVRGGEARQRSEAELAGAYGASLAAHVMTLPVATWSQPIQSSYGFHLVRVTERTAGGLAPLADVRATVARDWRAEHQREASRMAIDRLRRRYSVEVERPAETIAQR